MTENLTNSQPRQRQQARPTLEGGSGAECPEAPSGVPCSQGSDFPTPDVISRPARFYWNEDDPPSENYRLLGEALNSRGDLFRNPGYGDGLLLGSPSPDVPPRSIRNATELAAIITDRLQVLVFKDGKCKGSQISATHLKTMLCSEVFLQQFRPVDKVITAPIYLPNFSLVVPGYNDGGRDHRFYFAGEQPEVAESTDTINQFLDVMAFASNADRTNAVAGALTVMFRNLWAGQKPILAVTSTKSHGGKDTLISFMSGLTKQISISHEKQDWALQKNFAATIKHNPDIGLINIENVRLENRQACLQSAFLERFLTDPNPTIFTTGTGDPRPRRNDIVLATTTNFAQIGTDLLNRGLPSSLNPVGDVAARRSPIGNPRYEFLPQNRHQIAAELRGMIERWKSDGQPLDETVRHPFTNWARTIGGILRASGFEDFLANYSLRKTQDDPLRAAIGLLGTERPGTWLQAKDWALVVAHLGLVKTLIPEADRECHEGCQRGIGKVLSAHRNETFRVETDDEIFLFRLERGRRRFVPGEQPSTRYRFVVLEREPVPCDDEDGHTLED